MSKRAEGSSGRKVSKSATTGRFVSQSTARRAPARPRAGEVKDDAAAGQVYATRDDPDAEGDVVETTVSKNLSTVVSVRLTPADVAQIEAVARARGMKLSAFLRQAALLQSAAARDVDVTAALQATVADVQSRLAASLAELQTDINALLVAGIAAANAGEMQRDYTLAAGPSV
jgi:hypothetical protein